MPIYEYRCRNGHRFEVSQSMSEDPVTSCDECGAATERVFHPVAVHFKGSGFYTTDYARKGQAGGDGGEAKKESGDKAKAKEGSGSGKGGDAGKSGSGSAKGGDSGSSKGDSGGKAKAGAGSD